MEGLKGQFLSLCVLAIFVLMGKLMRAKIKLFQGLFLPSSIIAGFLALLAGKYALGGWFQKMAGYELIPQWIYSNWSELPGVLINVVFASLFLGVAIPGMKKIWSYGGPQLCFGTIMGMGQYFIALLVTTLILAPLFGTPTIFACILEIGFSGGHGTAAGMADTFKQLGFPAGSDLGQMSATVGIICAVVVGMALINVAIRRGYTAILNEEKGIPQFKRTGLIPRPKRFSIMTATVATEAIEPVTFHFAIVALSILIGWVMLGWVKKLFPVLSAFPLFPLAMIGGIIVQIISTQLKIDHYYDKDTFERILGFSLDVLVVSAIASIRLDLFFEHLAPFMILMLFGILWVVFCVIFLGPRMFPRFWFEHSIVEFGMQTGVTAIGLLLLRVVDPLFRTDTATSFGFKQMIYEPFLGGGFITALAPILVVSLGPIKSIVFCLAIMILFFGIAYFNKWVNLSPNMVSTDELDFLESPDSGGPLETMEE